MNLEDVIALIEGLRQSGLREFELREEGCILRLKWGASASTSKPPYVPISDKAAPGIELLRAPLAGVFYVSPSPGAPPFVTEGCRIEARQTICVLESMKTLTSVAAPRPGTMRRIVATIGELVDFDMPLFEIEFDTA